MRARGFTLIELIVVLVLVGIMSVGITAFFSQAVQGYIDTANRQDSAAIARIALDRITRELREAMPQSVRTVTNAGNYSCVEFLPVVASTAYISVPANAKAIDVVDFALPITVGPFYAALYPVTANDLYVNKTALQTITSFGTTTANVRTLALASGFPAPNNSPGERLYIVGNPISFCIESSGQLNRYISVAIASAQPTPVAGLINGAPLATKLDAANSFFNYSGGTWKSNALLTIALRVVQQSSSNETLTIDHEVWLRNVQ